MIPYIATFSIVAHDPENGDLGVAVAVEVAPALVVVAVHYEAGSKFVMPR